ncbi:YggL family protein [bacterium]|nr:YggL family protein [bacterium]
MNKRLRKKYHLKEFTEFGFGFGFRYQCESDAERDALIDEFITMMESQGLDFGGSGSDGELNGYALGQKGSANEKQRAAATDWFIKNPKITAYAVTALTDAWNAPLDSHYTESLEYQTK